MREGLSRVEGLAGSRRSGPLRVLFLCSRNRRRSPTAEQVFGGYPGVETASAGLADDADEVGGPEHLAWAGLIIVMEPVHRRRLQQRFGSQLRRTRVAVLDIPDKYEFMDPDLVVLLERRSSRCYACSGESPLSAHSGYGLVWNADIPSKKFNVTCAGGLRRTADNRQPSPADVDGPPFGAERFSSVHPQLLRIAGNLPPTSPVNGGRC